MPCGTRRALAAAARAAETRRGRERVYERARARGCERGERGEGYLSRSIDEGVSLSLPFSRRQARARAEVEWSGWWMYDFSAREKGE